MGAGNRPIQATKREAEVKVKGSKARDSIGCHAKTTGSGRFLPHDCGKGFFNIGFSSAREGTGTQGLGTLCSCIWGQQWEPRAHNKHQGGVLHLKLEEFAVVVSGEIEIDMD